MEEPPNVHAFVMNDMQQQVVNTPENPTHDIASPTLGRKKSDMQLQKKAESVARFIFESFGVEIVDDSPQQGKAGENTDDLDPHNMPDHPATLAVSQSFAAADFSNVMCLPPHVVRMIDCNGDGNISFEELKAYLVKLQNADWREQVAFAFTLWDKDGSGDLTTAEITAAVEDSLRASALNLNPKSIKNLAAKFVSALDRDGDGSITLDELTHVLERNKDLRRAFEFSPLKFLDAGLQNAQAKSAKSFRGGLSHSNSSANLNHSGSFHVSATNAAAAPDDTSNNDQSGGTQGAWYRRQRTVMYFWVVMYIAATIALAIRTSFSYKEQGASLEIQVARAGGVNLNLHAVMLIWLMLRKTHFFIGYGSAFISRLIGLDFTIAMHRWVGVMCIPWTIVHVAGHLANYSVNLGGDTEVFLFSNRKKQGWVDGTAGITGVALTLLLIVISLGYGLRKCNFELFQMSHRLTYAYLGLMIPHATNCWKWLCAPLALLVLEQVFRFIVCCQPCSIARAYIHPKNVSELVINLPKLTGPCPAGTYAFICIPELSLHEWHPFTLSNANVRGKNTVSFHIRGNGDATWTGRLWKLVHRCIQDRKTVLNSAAITIGGPLDVGGTHNFLQPLSAQSSLKSNGGADARRTTPRANGTPKAAKSPLNAKSPSTGSLPPGTAASEFNFTVFFDGPYYAPSIHVFQSEHALFVAGGIGVTPLAALLDDVHRRALLPVPDFGSLKRLDLCWLMNDLDCTAWFTKLFSSVVALRDEVPALAELLFVRIYLTSISDKEEAEGAMLCMIADVLSSPAAGDDENDVNEAAHGITGLKSKVFVGRPKWNETIKSLQAASPTPANITTFFCGPGPMGVDLKANCLSCGVNFREEVFE